jgi:hypothetical protein
MLDQFFNPRNWPDYILIAIALSVTWIPCMNFFISGKRCLRKDALIIYNHGLLCSNLYYLIYFLILLLFFWSKSGNISNHPIYISTVAISFLILFFGLYYVIKIHNRPAILITPNKIILFNNSLISIRRKDVSTIYEYKAPSTTVPFFPKTNVVFYSTMSSDSKSISTVFAYTRVTWRFSKFKNDLRSYGWEV